MSLTEELKESIDNLNSGQKTSLAVFFMLVFGLMIGVIVWAGSDNYTTVLRSSDLSRVRAASTALEEAGIDHKISTDGTSIETSRMNVGKARIISTGSGSISGMEALGSIELGSSPQHERWVYMNLLQGELTRTINALDEVTACRVHIVEPDDSPFMNRSSKGSASVTVQLDPGSMLSPLQVRGITHLVAGAVKGLSPKDVVLVDDSGKLLSGQEESEEDAMNGGSSSLFELKYKYESQYRKKLMNLLGLVMGSTQQVSATVNVELNTEAVEKNSTQLLPETQVTISERLNEASSKESNPQGIPGAETNLPEQAPPAEEGNGENKFQSSTNYDYTRVNEREVKPAGSIKSISVAILIDLATANELIKTSQDNSLETLREDIENAVKNTVGFKEKRDQVKVSFVPFAGLSQDVQEVSAEGVSWVNEWRYVIVMIMALLIVYFGIIRPFVQSITASMQQDQERKESERKRLLDNVANDGDLDRLQLLARDFTTADKNELNNLVERFEQPSAEVIKRWIRSS